jgi:thiamine-monophosphate kinase
MGCTYTARVLLRDRDEFELIARIERIARDRLPGVSLGIGDDAALLRLRPGEEVVVTTDAFFEDVHFRWRDEAPAHVGRRAMVACLSDLAAMGARPLGCTLGLAAPGSLALRRFDALVRGVVAEGMRHRAPLVGGNLSRARETSLSLTGLGAVAAGAALTRRGTRAGDRVLVTGTLGAAALDRARAARGGRLRHDQQPRLEAGRRLARVPGVVACIDVSDGLLADLAHLLGSRLELPLARERLPLARGLRAGARRLGLEPERLALAGGEDYELLFTLRGETPSEAQLARRLGLPVRELGRVRRASRRRPRGEQPASGGWRHF